MNRRDFLIGSLALSLGCTRRRRVVTVGSKNFTEQLALGELLAQRFEARSIPVERRFYLAGTYICHQAMLAGRIDGYVEYTGTALSAILKQPPMHDHDRVYRVVREEYARRFGLEVFPSLGFDNSFAMVIRGDDAQRLRVKTISDVAKYAPQWRIGVGYEFLEREDGFKGLVETYGLHFAEMPRVMDLGLLYRSLQSRQVDIVAGSNTDGLIAALGFVALEDDRQYFPPYDAVPIVRREAVEQFPHIADELRHLAGRITAEQMRRLNYAIDGEHKDAREAVRSFLAAQRL